MCRKDDSVFAAELTLEPFTDESGGDFVAELRDVSHRKLLEDELSRLARHDPLTNILNRRSFTEAFEIELQRARRQNYPLCVALLDIDHFKSINDTFGHKAGDDALCEFAEFCQALTRATDIFARFGGEEFTLLMPDTSAEGARVILERLRLRVQDHWLRNKNKGIELTISTGYSAYLKEDTQDTMLQRADQALYKAKQGGRNSIEFQAPEPL